MARSAAYAGADGLSAGESPLRLFLWTAGRGAGGADRGGSAGISLHGPDIHRYPPNGAGQCFRKPNLASKHLTRHYSDVLLPLGLTYEYRKTAAARLVLLELHDGADGHDGSLGSERLASLRKQNDGTFRLPQASSQASSVVLAGMYGLRMSEIIGLRTTNIDLEKMQFGVVEQMPFKVPPGTKTITEMAPTKSNDRILPITEEALPYFLRQFDLIARQKALTEAGGGVYYDNKLFIAKPDGSPQRRDRMSANFGQLIRHLEMPHIRFHDFFVIRQLPICTN